MGVDSWVIRYVKMDLWKKELSVGTTISQIAPYISISTPQKGGYFLVFGPHNMQQND
jgi:hypothetical protein